jgi:hypothetical protein
LKRRADVTHRYKYTGITHWEEYEGGFDVDYALDPDWRRCGELDKLRLRLRLRLTSGSGSLARR